MTGSKQVRGTSDILASDVRVGDELVIGKTGSPVERIGPARYEDEILFELANGRRWTFGPDDRVRIFHEATP